VLIDSWQEGMEVWKRERDLACLHNECSDDRLAKAKRDRGVSVWACVMLCVLACAVVCLQVIFFACASLCRCMCAYVSTASVCV
jgi:hypothetical protein